MARTTTGGRRWRAPVLAAALGASVVIGVVGATASVAGSQTTPTYVALGDSYTAGPLIPNQLDNPLGCLRSSNNYPHLAAATLGLSLTDMSCSGATTADMTTSQNVTIGTNPAQFSALSSTTDVVSLGIGGNDLGFSSIIENCAALTPWGPTPDGITCKSHYDANGVDQLAAQVTALGPKIAGVLQGIHHLAPVAKVFVVGYPDILPTNSNGCWPSMPLTETDVPYLNSVENDLNSMLATESQANGATFVNTYTASEPHNACTPEGTRWVEPIIPDSLAAPVHPNATGEAAMAGMLESAMRSAGIS